ncbi:MAG: Holliday junction resolvase RuvX [Firmicutes bacterium]|nr:Holliday junction resolvase RuvX [Bacillota bacterium]
MRYLGIDLGSKTIGLAVSDELGLVATGIEVVPRVGWKKDTARIRQVIAEYEIGALVVGLPIRTDGTEGPEAQGVREWADRLQRQVQLPLYYADERFSTAIAEQALLTFDVSRQKRRKVVDQVAAAVILQTWLDRRRAQAHQVDD